MDVMLYCSSLIFFNLNMVHSYSSLSRSLLTTSFWYLCWTFLLHHWSVNPLISTWKGIPFNVLLTCLFCSGYAVSCFVDFSTSGISIHILFLAHIFRFALDNWLCSDLRLRREGCALAYCHRFVTPSGESYLYLARNLWEGWQKHNNRSKWLWDVKSSPIVQKMTTESHGKILGERPPERGSRNATSSVDSTNVIHLQFNLPDTLHPLKSC